MNNSLSVVIITYNNYLYKFGCIESVILALLNQKDVDFEIIVVDNCSSKNDKNLLEKFVAIHCKNKEVKIIQNEINNISKGRNIGVCHSKNDLVLFIDDDIILSDKYTLKKIMLRSRIHTYGYSAERKWSQKNWYQTNKYSLNKRIIKNEGDYKILTVEPDPIIRRKQENRHLTRTYIGNFGFAIKSVLEKVGGWDECYNGYGIEDDDMALKLYLNFGRPVLLNDISVIHIWHEINLNNYNQLYENQKRFQMLLREKNIECFHMGRILYNEKDVLEFGTIQNFI